MPRITGRTGPDPIDLHVGARVVCRRLEIGVTQINLAKLIGVSFQQVQKYEKGSNRISGSMLLHMARALGVSVAYFYEGLDQSTPEAAIETQLSTTPTGRRALVALRALSAGELAAVTIMLEAFGARTDAS